ncbi:DNA-processing protein DprA [Thiovibrio sp. JS02]
MDTRHLWLTLALTPGLGPATIKKLLHRFGTVSQVFSAGYEALTACSFLRKESVPYLSGQKNALAAGVAKELFLAEKTGITILGWDDPLFPPLLKEIPDPPVVLYVKGSPQALGSRGVAIVGARAASSYGLQVAEKLASDLVKNGLAITSGLALGIDGAAHRGALAAGGITIAVMGCGLDVVYPVQNKKLHDQIAETGAVISEYPFATMPENFRFPARNRIISGLSLGVVVVEAARRSGTLITAHQALEQGREVFTVPGRIDSPKSEGCHRLAQEGAKLIHSAGDILDELSMPLPQLRPPRNTKPAESLTPEEATIFAALEVYPKTIEQIISAARLPAQRVDAILLTLELRGLAASLPGKQYQRLA